MPVVEIQVDEEELGAAPRNLQQTGCSEKLQDEQSVGTEGGSDSVMQCYAALGELVDLNEEAGAKQKR